MKISPCFAHPRGILDLCDTFLSDESNRSYIKNVLALPSFIMAWVGVSVQPNQPECFTFKLSIKFIVKSSLKSSGMQ